MTKRINDIACETAYDLRNDIMDHQENYRMMWSAWFFFYSLQMKKTKTFDEWHKMMTTLADNVYMALQCEENKRERIFSQETENMRVQVEIMGKGTQEEPWYEHATIMIVYKEMVW